MSIKIDIKNQKGEKVKDMNLSDKVFNVAINEALVHQAVVAQMANERQVIAHTKDRSEVRGGGAKPWRQKGTGRARVGSNRSPIWIGGGVTFGPTKDRNFKKKINIKMRQKAILMALSDKVASNSLIVLDKIEVKEYKTKIFKDIIDSLIKEEKPKAVNPSASSGRGEDAKVNDKKEDKKVKSVKRTVLVINDKKDDKVKLVSRNLADVKLINLSNINIVDLLKHRNLILTVDAVKKIEEKYSK